MRLLDRFKMPLSRKLSLVFITLFLLILTIFTMVAFVSTNGFLFKNELINVEKTVDTIGNRVSEVDTSLTMGNLTTILYKGASTDDLVVTEQGLHVLRSERDIANMVYSNQTIYIYDAAKKFIFTTDNQNQVPGVRDIGKAVEHRINGLRGFILTKAVYGKTTQKIIGYVQVFHNLEAYYVLQERLLMLFAVVELVGALIALLIIRFSMQRFLSPLHRLHDVMTYIADDPSEMSLRSNIQTGDEIEELSIIFDQMMDRVEDYSRLQSRFVSDVSHELRTPVAVIKGHLDLLQRWGKNDPEILNESLEASRLEAERMNIMIKDMLDMIRVQGSFENHQNDKTDLTESINMVISNFRVLHPEFDITFDNETYGLVEGRIYKTHFEQAITILTDNAVKYSPKHKDIIIRLATSGNDALIKIKDRGEGISKEDIKHIFERFYRTDKSRNRTSTQAGLGIGLSILKQIMEAYHCKLDVESEVGVGTEFSLRIPLVK